MQDSIEFNKFVQHPKQNPVEALIILHKALEHLREGATFAVITSSPFMRPPRRTGGKSLTVTPETVLESRDADLAPRERNVIKNSQKMRKTSNPNPDPAKSHP